MAPERQVGGEGLQVANARERVITLGMKIRWHSLSVLCA